MIEEEYEDLKVEQNTEKVKRKRRTLEERIEHYQNELKKSKRDLANQNRKKRARRLIQVGAVIESVLGTIEEDNLDSLKKWAENSKKYYKPQTPTEQSEGGRRGGEGVADPQKEERTPQKEEYFKNAQGIKTDKHGYLYDIHGKAWTKGSDGMYRHGGMTRQSNMIEWDKE